MSDKRKIYIYISLCSVAFNYILILTAFTIDCRYIPISFDAGHPASDNVNTVALNQSLKCHRFCECCNYNNSIILLGFFFKCIELI